MTHQPYDLSLFRKQVRSKIRLSIYMNNLLHFIYLAIKNFPDQSSRYETFWDLIKDVDFARKVLLKEGRFGKPELDPLKYLDLTKVLQERGYTDLLELANTVWDLTVHHRRIHYKSLFNSLLGIRSSLLDNIKLYGKISYRCKPFIMKIKSFNFIVIETELAGNTEALAKTLIWIGRFIYSDKNLGLFVRFSIRSIDAEHIRYKQEKGYLHHLLNDFRLYPTVLRMQRLAYNKVGSKSNLYSEVIKMLSELYIDNNQLLSLIDLDVPANILAMAPSISLNGGLCLVSAFRGELLDILGAKNEARIRVADTIIKAYQSYYTVFDTRKYPGEYLFISFHPFTIPRVCLIVATLPLNMLDKIKPERRNVLSLNSLFPKIKEIVKTLH